MRMRSQRLYSTFMWWCFAAVIAALAADIITISTVNTYRNITQAVCFFRSGQ